MEQSKRGTLVISRHAESEWNLLGKWTGLTDVNLTTKGKKESEMLGKLVQGITFDHIYTSTLKRTKQTCEGILRSQGQGVDMESDIIVNSAELNERDYGDLTGKNKWEVKEEIGEEAFNGIRRGWDYPVPGGETLKDVYNRVIPYFQSEILPKLQNGDDVLVVAHGNSIRALMKYLDSVEDEDIASVEMPFGTLLFYTFDSEHDLPIQRDSRMIDIVPPHA